MPSLAAALRFESLERFSPFPPLAGDGINDMLAVEGYRTYRRLCGDSIDVPADAAADAVVLPCEMKSVKPTRPVGQTISLSSPLA